MRVPGAVLLLLLGAATAAQAQGYAYQRHYRIGETYGYSLKTDTYGNGTLSSESLAESHHEVVLQDGVPSERVTFLSFKESKTPEGDFSVMDDLARQVPSFYISLDPGGTIAVPRLIVPQMTGSITDLITFWVAMSARVGIGSLHQAGDSAKAGTPLLGNWSDGAATPVGRDKLDVVTRLVADERKTVTFRAEFRPPAADGLEPAFPWMTQSVSGKAPNNFQQVKTDAKALHSAMWGSESFTVTTTVDRDSGIIVNATLSNELSLMLRLGCSSTWEGCTAQMPYTISRTVELSLLPAE